MAKSTIEKPENVTTEKEKIEEETIEEETIEEEKSESPVDPPKKRGRGRPATGTNPRKSRPKKRPQASNIDSAKLGRQLVGIHLMCAQMTGIHEAQISESEGIALAESIVKICDEYGLAISGKTGATIQLLGTLAVVYVPRVISFEMRKGAAQKQAQQSTEINAVSETNNIDPAVMGETKGH